VSVSRAIHTFSKSSRGLFCRRASLEGEVNALVSPTHQQQRRRLKRGRLRIVPQEQPGWWGRRQRRQLRRWRGGGVDGGVEALSLPRSSQGCSEAQDDVFGVGKACTDSANIFPHIAGSSKRPALTKPTVAGPDSRRAARSAAASLSGPFAWRAKRVNGQASCEAQQARKAPGRASWRSGAAQADEHASMWAAWHALQLASCLCA
jgi:hypothetical protein